VSRTPARVTQADVARAIRAAKQAGAGIVEITPDGVIRIVISPAKASDGELKQVELEHEVVL
jgi:hypothetical protein